MNRRGQILTYTDERNTPCRATKSYNPNSLRPFALRIEQLCAQTGRWLLRASCSAESEYERDQEMRRWCAARPKGVLL